jgi:PiT family inorganic phosphate transporter
MGERMGIGIALGCALLLTYGNGANDNFKGVATLYGSGTTDYRKALIWATLTTFAGAIAAIWVTAHLVAAFSGKLFISQAVLMQPGYPLAVCAGAAATVLLATRFGLPVSTTHALAGALIGAALLASAGAGVDWAKAGKTVFLPLALSPLLSIVIATALYPLLSLARRRLGIRKESCVCVGEEVGINFGGSAVASVTMSTGLQADCNQRYTGTVIGIAAGPAMDRLHFLSAGAVGFARGMNDTPKLVALMILCAPLLQGSPSFVLVAITMALGGILGSRRVAQTMSQGITAMNPGQGFTANLVTSGLVIAASPLGLPVSTTHVSCGALFGIGAVTGQGRWKTIAGIALAWLATLPLAGLLGALAMKLAQGFQ